MISHFVIRSFRLSIEKKLEKASNVVVPQHVRLMVECRAEETEIVENLSFDDSYSIFGWMSRYKTNCRYIFQEKFLWLCQEYYLVKTDTTRVKSTPNICV